ncbi:MAG: PaaI family thioesterase [candidate division KSB1 bacterium]|nr:PaaI family thioesterase [candidate division KSB1 bacterium]
MSLKKIKEFFEKRDRFAAHNDIELVSVETGKAVASMRIQDKHLNGAEVVHGGALFTLADYAFAAATNSHGTFSLAINVNIQFIKGVSSGVVTAYAQEIAVNSKLSSCRVTIYDESNEIIATFQGLAYRKNKPLPV